MRSRSFAGGSIVIATLAAGPLFMMGMVLGLWLSDPAEAIDPNNVPAGGILLLPFAMIFGALLAVAPNLLGAALMRWLGARNIAMQLPVAWLLPERSRLGAARPRPTVRPRP